MKRTLLNCLFLALICLPAAAQSRFILRDTHGLNGIKSLCAKLGCTVGKDLDAGQGQIYRVNFPAGTDLTSVFDQLSKNSEIKDFEPDQLLFLQQSGSTTLPYYAEDQTPVPYYGSTVWDGYITQPAAQQVNLPEVQNNFHNTGAGTVAIIDTGVDPSSTVLQPVLLPGYDFTRNSAGGSEMADLNQHSAAVVNQHSAAVVNQHSAAVVNQHSAAVVNQASMAVVNQHSAAVVNQDSTLSDFGHGTMVAGIVHLVAPTARLMPLKAFSSDGTGYLSDVIRAIYYAVQNHANVLNMSFDLYQPSSGLQNALTYADSHGVVSVASVGNDGQQITVYPAGYTGNVMGVASVANDGTLSTFSNYGPMVFVAAPGENVLSIYPGNLYALGSGTSFSAPFVSGAVALLLGAQSNGLNQAQAAADIAQATSGDADLGHGILNLETAIEACLDTQ